MKNLFILLFATTALSTGKLTIEKAKEAARTLEIGSYSYHEQFIGHSGYGAPVILTSDGGGALFGGATAEEKPCAALVKLDTAGKEVWRKNIFQQFTDMESQSVVQDKKGNFYTFMLSYDNKRYRGGSQRIVVFDKTGKKLWDKTIGKYTLENNPIISYIKCEKDNRIALRGHMVKDKPAEGKDPVYRYWEGWIDIKGVLTQKTGDILNWADKTWQDKFKPE